MSITHNLDNLTEKQKLDLDLAETLLHNINSLKHTGVRASELHYDGQKFTETNTGFYNSFLIHDIKYSLNGNLTAHFDFIKDTIQKEFKKFDFSKNLIQLKFECSVIINYYKKHPFYKEIEGFKNTIDEWDKAIQNDLSKYS